MHDISEQIYLLEVLVIVVRVNFSSRSTRRHPHNVSMRICQLELNSYVHRTQPEIIRVSGE